MAQFSKRVMLSMKDSNRLRRIVYNFISKYCNSIADACDNVFEMNETTFYRGIGTKADTRRITLTPAVIRIANTIIEFEHNRKK